MSDVVAAALIAASVGVLGSAATVAVALVTTGRQTRADAERLRREHREADRRVRRDAYANFLIAIERIDMLTSAYTPPPTLDGWTQALEHFRAAGVAVRLVESQPVGNARRAMSEILNEVAEKVMHNVDANIPLIDAIGVPYVQAQPRLRDAGRALGDAMRDDLAFAP